MSCKAGLLILSISIVTAKNVVLQSFHCTSPHKMSAAKLDPSCTIGFYCKTQADFEKLIRDAEMVRVMCSFINADLSLLEAEQITKTVVLVRNIAFVFLYFWPTIYPFVCCIYL